MNQDTQRRTPFRPSSWSVVHRIEQEGLMVEITQDSSRSSVYSVRVGRKPKEGEERINPNIPIYLRTEVGKIEIKAPFVPDTIQSLLEQAEGWIADRAQSEMDVRIEKMQAHETRHDRKDGPKLIRSPGKTERDKNKSRGPE